MKIIVCVKQVPGTSNVKVDPVTGVLIRDGLDSKLNPYDLFALEMAFSLAEKYGGEVHTLSMGPQQAMETLKETIAMGAKSGTLLSDRAFAGSDVCATSYALKCGVEAVGEFDLIICGKQTTDGDTAQVGSELSEILGIEHATNVTDVCNLTEKYIDLVTNLDDVLQTQRMELPCLISTERDVNTPRLPSIRRLKEVKAEDITVVTTADIPGIDLTRCGLKGSPTQVERIFPPEKMTDKQMFEGSEAESAALLADLLKQKKFI